MQFIVTRPDSGPLRKGHQEARRAGLLSVVGTDGGQLERSAREGGNSNSSSSGGAGNEDVYGLGVRDRRHNGRDCGRNRGGGVPGSKRVQWIGVEQGGGQLTILL